MGEVTAVPNMEKFSLMTTKLGDAIGWARKFSIFQYPFVTACCGMEFMSVAAPKYDIARFGAEFPRFSPRQADLLIIVGTISEHVTRSFWMMSSTPSGSKWFISTTVAPSDIMIATNAGAAE